MPKNNLIGFYGTVVVAIGLFFLSWPFHSVLQICAAGKEGTGSCDKCAVMDEGEEFVLSFVHSVNKRPVYDTIRVEGQRFIIVKSRYDSFGAGMPEKSTGDSKLKLEKDSWLEFTVNQSVPEVGFFLGWEANHCLHMKRQEIYLTRFFEPGTLLTLRLHKTSWYKSWKNQCIR